MLRQPRPCARGAGTDTRRVEVDGQLVDLDAREVEIVGRVGDGDERGERVVHGGCAAPGGRVRSRRRRRRDRVPVQQGAVAVERRRGEGHRGEGAERDEHCAHIAMAGEQVVDRCGDLLADPGQEHVEGLRDVGPISDTFDVRGRARGGKRVGDRLADVVVGGDAEEHSEHDVLAGDRERPGVDAAGGVDAQQRRPLRRGVDVDDGNPSVAAAWTVRSSAPRPNRSNPGTARIRASASSSAAPATSRSAPWAASCAAAVRQSATAWGTNRSSSASWGSSS